MASKGFRYPYFWTIILESRHSVGTLEARTMDWRV
jgi:hypothetical protein